MQGALKLIPPAPRHMENGYRLPLPGDSNGLARNRRMRDRLCHVLGPAPLSREMERALIGSERLLKTPSGPGHSR